MKSKKKGLRPVVILPPFRPREYEESANLISSASYQPGCLVLAYGHSGTQSGRSSVLVNAASSNSPGCSARAGSRVFKVALAEDEPPVLAIFSRILSRAEFSVIPFEDGKDLVDYITNNSDADPDVVITDFRMTKMNGIEAARKIRAIKPHIKIILASAYDVPADATKLFDVILRKPISSKELVDSVSACLDL